MRRQTNQQVSIRVNRGDTRTAKLMEIVNEAGFQEDLRTAVLDPNLEDANRLKKIYCHSLRFWDQTLSGAQWRESQRLR